VAKWPGVTEPCTIVNEVMAHEDWLPTLLAAAGQPDVKQKLLTGLEAGEKTFKVHLDGYDFTPYFTRRCRRRAPPRDLLLQRQR
jgi:arylsulfatase A-like enzyme